jgi:hypothetical protein
MEADLAELPVSEAAAALGVHVATIYRRIARGELLTRADGQGRTLVSLPDAAPQDATRDAKRDAPRESVSEEPIDADRDRLLAALQSENAWLRARLEAAETERGELRRLLGNEQQLALGAQAQMALLAAPDVPLEPPETSATPPVDALPAQTPATIEKTLKQARV